MGQQLQLVPGVEGHQVARRPRPGEQDRSRAAAKIRSTNASRSPGSFSRPSSSTASSGNAASTRAAYSPRPLWSAATPSARYRGMARMPQLGDLALNT